MYYVNQEQIDSRLSFVPELLTACRELELAFEERPQDPLLPFAQERILHLAIETVTDVGSLLIDAFMMRDASSYEDIVEILAGEGVMTPDIAEILQELVRLRRPLAQEYTTLERQGLHDLIGPVQRALSAFAEAVPAFIRRESL